MSETITAKAGLTTGTGSVGPRPPLDDPDLIEELEALEDPQDRADYMEALESLKESRDEELVSWEEVKAQLGL